MELPEPLTPADCDLSDFQYMELDVRRLRDSKFSASVDGEAFRAGVLLWCAAWHQVPAASLPDDDIELANLAGYGRVVKEWKKVRSAALSGFVKCSDGRLYHTVIAEKAASAYASKLQYAYGKLLDRLRKENKRREIEKLPLVGIPTFDQWKSGDYPNGIPAEARRISAGIPAENSLKGNREGTEQNGKGDIKASVPIGTGDESPLSGEPEKIKAPEEMTKEELWSAGKSLLEQGGIPKAQCGTIVGKLVKDYGNEIVIEAVRAAVLERPADAVSFLKASCMARKNEGGKSLIPWHATDEGVLAKGAEMTPPIKPLPGETNFAFKARVVTATESVGKPPAPKLPPPAIVLAGEPMRMSIEAVEQGRAAIRAAAGVRDKTA